MYSFSQKNLSRANGSNITAHISYISNESLYSRDDGLTKYPHRKDKNEEIISYVIDVDAKRQDRATKKDLQQFVSEVETVEKRKNSCIGKTFIIALPKELTAEKRKELTISYCNKLSELTGTKVVVSIHNPPNEETENHHFHAVLLDRKYKDGAYATHKNREMNIRNGGRELTQILRKEWELLLNQSYIDNGLDKQITCLSHKDRANKESIKDANEKIKECYKKRDIKLPTFEDDYTQILLDGVKPTIHEYYNPRVKSYNKFIKHHNKNISKVHDLEQEIELYTYDFGFSFGSESDPKEKKIKDPTPTIINNNITIINIKKRKKVVYKIAGLDKVKKVIKTGIKWASETPISGLWTEVDKDVERDSAAISTPKQRKYEMTEEQRKHMLRAYEKEEREKKDFEEKINREIKKKANKTTKKRTVLSASLRRAKNQHIPKI